MLTGRLFQYSRKPKDVQIYSPQPAQSRGTPNGSQPRHQKSSTDGLAQGSYGTWSGPPPLSPAVSTSRSTLPHATNNSASVYSYTVASGPSREQIIQRAAERGPTDTITFVPISVLFLPFPPRTPGSTARSEWLGVPDRYFSSLLQAPSPRVPGGAPYRSLSKAQFHDGVVDICVAFHYVCVDQRSGQH